MSVNKSKKRIVLVDFMHLMHKLYNVQPLSTTCKIGGVVETVDTTMPTITIKSIFKYSGRGDYPIGVFLEGGNSVRKAYFKAMNSTEDYKGSRPKQKNSFYKGTDLTVNLLNNGGVRLYRVAGKEADDLIGSAVRKFKEEYPDYAIDIVTNDSDLLPLVDSQVSVYMRATRQYSEPGCPVLNKYYQVTPDSWEDFLGYSSKYKNYYIPFNTMLLFKMIKGDKSDDVAAKFKDQETGRTLEIKGYGAKKYSSIMEDMENDYVDFDIFRYGVDFDTVMKPVLLNYFTEDEVKVMRYIYKGICLDMNIGIQKPLLMDEGRVQKAILPLNIHLR
ncbi:DNA polymerase I, thermostable [compost metagenome]